MGEFCSSECNTKYPDGTPEDCPGTWYIDLPDGREIPECGLTDGVVVFASIKDVRKGGGRRATELITIHADNPFRAIMTKLFDIERELFPEQIFEAPAGVYFALQRLIASKISVEFSGLPSELTDKLEPASVDELPDPKTEQFLEDVRQAAREHLITRLATEAANADFGTGTNTELKRLAEQVRQHRAKKDGEAQNVL